MTLDRAGRGTVRVRLGGTADEAWLVARRFNDAQELLITASVSFQVLPGAAVGQSPFPADTAVGVGAAYSLSLRPVDRLGNVRPEASPDVVFRSLSLNVTVDATGGVAAGTTGRGAVELRTPTLVDTAWLSVVPQGTVAFVGPDGERWRNHPFRGRGALQVQDLNGSNRRLIVPAVAPPASPRWSPDGSRLVLGVSR